MPTPNEMDEIFSKNIPLGATEAYGGYQPQLGQQEAEDLDWQRRSAPLMKPLGGWRTPEEMAADEKLFSTPSSSALEPQLQGGQDAASAQPSGLGWQGFFAGLADAGAALQGREGTSLQNLLQLRRNQDELQQKRELAKRQQSMDDLKLFNEMLKMPRAVREKASNRLADPILRDMAKSWKDSDVELYSRAVLPFLGRYRKGEAEFLEKAIAAGELNGETLKSHWELNRPALEQFQKLQAKETHLDRLREQIKTNPSLEKDAGFMDAVRALGEDVQGLDFELLGKKQASEKGARENRIGEATEDQARLQAVLKTIQEANTLGQQLPGGVQYRATQQAAAHNQRLAEQPRIERVPMGDQEAVVAFYPDGRREIVSVGGQELKGPRKPGVEVNINPSAEERKSEAADRNYIQDLRRLGKMVKPDWVGFADEKIGRLGQTAGVLSQEREMFIQANQALFTALRNKAFGATLTKEERRAAEDAFPNPKMQYEQYKASIDAWMRTYGRKIELAEVGRQLNAEQRQELDHLLNDPRFDGDSVYDMADYIQRNWKK